MNISTLCNPRDFKRTVSKLSDIKSKAIDEMGLGCLRLINCTRLDRPLCQMLVDNFDSQNNSIRVHGRSFPITHTDFQRIMGVRDGGYVVDLNGSIEDPDIIEFRKIFGGSKNEMTVELMKEIVLDRAEVDDTFRIGFFLYALAILLCPGTFHVVNPKFLLPLRDTKTIHLKNWASFSFDKLLEGLRSYKNDSSDYLAGCILFLQLFYYDIIPYSSVVINKRVIPIVCWGNLEGKKLLGWVEEHGGLDSPKVFVSNALIPKLGGNSDHYETEILNGIHCHVSQEDTSVKAQVSLVKTHAAVSKLTVARMACDLTMLQDRVGRIDKSLADIKEEILNQVHAGVMGVLKRVGTRELSHLKEHDTYLENAEKRHVVETECGTDFTAVGVHNADKKRSNASKDYSTREVAAKIKGAGRESCIDSRRTKQQRVGLYSLMGDFSAHDSQILNFLFTTKHLTKDESSELVARYVDFSITREQILCLAPLKYLSEYVINICGEYLYDNVSSSWFFPTCFGERAKDYIGQMPLQVWIDDTVRICRLRRFQGRMKHCAKIFIPLHDDPGKHWFLLVVHLPHNQAELWDSSPNEGGKLRRIDIAKAAIWLLDNVIKHDSQMSFEVAFNFASFTIINPEFNPIQDNSHDCGIYVIRHMQHYGNRWYQGFNSEDQRIRLALEIVKHPQNEVRAAVNIAITAHNLQCTKFNGRTKHANVPPVPGTCDDIVYCKRRDVPTIKKSQYEGPRKYRNHRRRR